LSRPARHWRASSCVRQGEALRESIFTYSALALAFRAPIDDPRWRVQGPGVFLRETPRAALEDLIASAQEHRMKAAVGRYAEKESLLDAPVTFVDFVIEATAPDLAAYGIEA
jgi:hypothetical protein